MAEEKKPKPSEYELVQVPTEHVLAVKDPEGKVMSMEQATVEILNTVQKIRELIG